MQYETLLNIDISINIINCMLLYFIVDDPLWRITIIITALASSHPPMLFYY